MPITEPCYCTREEVKTATDFQGTAYNNVQIDRAIQAASRDIDSQMKRKFYIEDTTRYFDWPAQGGQGGGFVTYPWKIYFDRNDLISLTSIQSPPGTNLNVNFINLEPANDGPPYTYMEFQRNQQIAWAGGPTPQRSIVVTGTWGYTNVQDAAGTMANNYNSSATSIQVSNGALIGVGDVITVDAERMIVQDKAAVLVQAEVGTGADTASDTDNVITVSNGALFNVGETLLMDSEKMLLLDVTGNNLTVKRAYDGTVLATHSAGDGVFAYRLLTVLRGQLGTTAVSLSTNDVITRLRVPALINRLAVALAINTVLQETSGYSRQVGADQGRFPATGGGLDDLKAQAKQRHGRKSRYRAV